MEGTKGTRCRVDIQEVVQVEEVRRQRRKSYCAYEKRLSRAKTKSAGWAKARA